MKRVLLICLLTLTPYSVSHGQPGWFFGVGGGFVSFDNSVDSVEPVNLVLRGGLALNDFIEIGAEVGNNLAEDDVSGVDYTVDGTFIFIKANLNLSEGTRVYAMIGKSSIELTQGAGSASVVFDDSDTGIGFGLQFTLSPKSSYFVDYISYYDDDQFDSIPGDITVDGLNIGYLSYF